MDYSITNLFLYHICVFILCFSLVSPFFIFVSHMFYAFNYIILRRLCQIARKGHGTKMVKNLSFRG